MILLFFGVQVHLLNFYPLKGYRGTFFKLLLLTEMMINDGTQIWLQLIDRAAAESQR
jgi:hypothetical protein